MKCPHCGSTDVKHRAYNETVDRSVYKCRLCSKRFRADENGIRGDGGTDLSTGGTERILDATCGGRQMWLDENKDRDDTLYIDSRREEKGFVDEAVPESLRPNNPNYSVEPDEVEDFRDLPYPDESFNLVVFDPPHVIRSDGMKTLTGVITKKYGCLHAETWQEDLRRGFVELFRVLAPGGTLVFKFADMDTDFQTVLELAPRAPLFGTTTSKKKNHETRWFVFYKPDTERSGGNQ